jgi:ferric-dicitrate binding protein FerR (iron transport regulator)
MTGINVDDGKAPARLGPGSGQDADVEVPHGEAAEPGDRPQKAHRRRRGWRTPVAAVLIVAGCILAPLSVAAVGTGGHGG